MGQKDKARGSMIQHHHQNTHTQTTTNQNPYSMSTIEGDFMDLSVEVSITPPHQHTSSRTQQARNVEQSSSLTKRSRNLLSGRGNFNLARLSVETPENRHCLVTNMIYTKQVLRKNSNTSRGSVAGGIKKPVQRMKIEQYKRCSAYRPCSNDQTNMQSSVSPPNAVNK